MNVSVIVLALLFAAAGTMHFVAPSFFEAIVPPWLPEAFPGARTLVYLSGAAELLGAVGLLIPATRTAAMWWLLALLLAVFPANVYMLQDAMARGAARWYLVTLWCRLPLQPLLMWWLWSAVRQR